MQQVQNHVYEMELGGRTLSIESGKYAFQAGGSVIVRCGDTAVMVNATGSKTEREGIDFFPLSVGYFGGPLDRPPDSSAFPERIL